MRARLDMWSSLTRLHASASSSSPSGSGFSLTSQKTTLERGVLEEMTTSGRRQPTDLMMSLSMKSGHNLATFIRQKQGFPSSIDPLSGQRSESLLIILRKRQCGRYFDTLCSSSVRLNGISMDFLSDDCIENSFRFKLYPIMRSMCMCSQRYWQMVPVGPCTRVSRPWQGLSAWQRAVQPMYLTRQERGTLILGSEGSSLARAMERLLSMLWDMNSWWSALRALQSKAVLPFSCFLVLTLARRTMMPSSRQIPSYPFPLRLQRWSISSMHLLFSSPVCTSFFTTWMHFSLNSARKLKSLNQLLLCSAYSVSCTQRYSHNRSRVRMFSSICSLSTVLLASLTSDSSSYSSQSPSKCSEYSYSWSTLFWSSDSFCQGRRMLLLLSYDGLLCKKVTSLGWVGGNSAVFYKSFWFIKYLQTQHQSTPKKIYQQLGHNSFLFVCGWCWDYSNKMDIIKKIKNYTINERHCLGQGSFGKVYEAVSDEGRKVAIKRVQQKLICSDRYLKESLDNEIAIMQKLKHPNIVQLYQVIYTQNNIYLILEYCSGGDLKRFGMTRKINEEMAFNIIRQVARGFEELNKFGIIHRDLKAANILVHQQVFKICDFGFAKYFGESGKMARTCVGTPIYMSPQVLKHKQYTSKTDVWSLGVLFFELLFARLPYNGYNEDDLHRNIIKGPLAIPECSKDALKLLQGTLIIEEEGRWGWAEVLEALFNKPLGIQRVRGNTPKQGIFYKEEQQASGDKLDKKVYDGQVVNNQVKVPINNNFIVDDGFEQVNSDRMKPEGFKKQAKNIFAIQGQGEEGRGFIPVAVQQPIQQVLIIEKQAQQNPRFIYFVLVELIVNPIQGSPTFDSFMFSLWKYVLELYQKLLERAELVTVYRAVLSAELNQIKNLQSELRVHKDGNPRKLGEVVFQEGRAIPTNKKKLIWLRRFLDRKFCFEPIE